MPRAGSYKSRLLKDVNDLSEGRVKALADFAAYLRQREEWEETADILGDQSMVQQITKSRRAWSTGKKGQFVSLSEIKARLDA